MIWFHSKKHEAKHVYLLYVYDGSQLPHIAIFFRIHEHYSTNSTCFIQSEAAFQTPKQWVIIWIPPESVAILRFIWEDHGELRAFITSLCTWIDGNILSLWKLCSPSRTDIEQRWRPNSRFRFERHRWGQKSPDRKESKEGWSPDPDFHTDRHHWALRVISLRVADKTLKAFFEG